MPIKITPETTTGKPLLQWSVKEYDQYNRGTRWYILMLAIAVTLVGWGIFTNNFLFSIIIILIAVILYLQSYQAPKEILFTITELGVAVHNRFYPYNELDKFFIIYRPPEVKTLFVQPKNLMRPIIRVPIMEENPVEVRNALREFMTEDPDREEEPLSDTVSRRWKIQ